MYPAETQGPVENNGLSMAEMDRQLRICIRGAPAPLGQVGYLHLESFGESHSA